MPDGRIITRVEAFREACRLVGIGWPLWLTIFLILYILGIGPAAKIHHRCPLARGAIEIIYFPLVSIAQSSPSIMTAMEWCLCKVWKLK